MARGEVDGGGGTAFQQWVVDGGFGHACGVTAGSAADLAAAAAASDVVDAFSGGDYGPSHGIGLLPYLNQAS